VGITALIWGLAPRPALLPVEGAFTVSGARPVAAPARTASPTAPACTRELALTAVADTWAWWTVLRIPPPSHEAHGSEPSLRTGYDQARGHMVAFVRFETGDLRAPADILFARLEAFVTVDPASRQRPETEIRLVEEAWDEATVRDDGFPQFRYDTLASAVGAGADAWVNWDVTEAVRAWAGGVPNHGLAMLTDQVPPGRSFASRETEHPPRLVVRTVCLRETATPTPTETQQPTETPSPTDTPSPTPTEPATSEPLPDLDGYGSQGCAGSPVAVVRNSGPASAGPFTVRAQDGAPEWRVAGLAPGVQLDLSPPPGSPDPLVIDADGEIEEADEGNNILRFAVPGCRHFLPLGLANSRLP
jgi:hypothetical protein